MTRLAKMLGLGYPGGVAIEEISKQRNIFVLNSISPTLSGQSGFGFQFQRPEIGG